MTSVTSNWADTGKPDGAVRRNEISGVERLHPALTVKARVEEYRAIARPDQPDHHGDVDALIARCTHHQPRQREGPDRRVSDRVDACVGGLLRDSRCGTGDRQQAAVIAESVTERASGKVQPPGSKR